MEERGWELKDIRSYKHRKTEEESGFGGLTEGVPIYKYIPGNKYKICLPYIQLYHIYLRCIRHNYR